MEIWLKSSISQKRNETFKIFCESVEYLMVEKRASRPVIGTAMSLSPMSSLKKSKSLFLYIRSRDANK